MKVTITLIALIIILGISSYQLLSKKTATNINPSPSLTSDNKAPKIDTVAKNLEVPWAIAFLPDGQLLVTERPGRLQKIVNGKTQLIHTFSEVKQLGEGGLHGIAVDPNFNTNHQLYAYFTYGQLGNQTLNRVIKAKLETDKLTEIKTIVNAIPGATVHDGGRIKFGPDGYLYITTGDAQNPSLSQDKNSLAGKILRVTDDGNPAPGNPFNTLVYSYGHRNPQGITWDNLGRLWATEHGNQATDELNLIEPGKNYGWPIIRGDEKRLDLISPKLQSGTNTWAPAGAAFYKGSILFAGLRGQALFEVKLDTLELKEHFKGELGRIREVAVGPDNMLYITTSNRDGRGNPKAEDDQILRVNPTSL